MDHHKKATKPKCVFSVVSLDIILNSRVAAGLRPHGAHVTSLKVSENTNTTEDFGKK